MLTLWSKDTFIASLNNSLTAIDHSTCMYDWLIGCLSAVLLNVSGKLNERVSVKPNYHIECDDICTKVVLDVTKYCTHNPVSSPCLVTC